MLSVALAVSEWNFNTNMQKFLSYILSITAGESWLGEFLECCGHLISGLLIEGAGRFTRLHPQVGVACSSLFFCSCFLEVWLMLSKILDHVGREYGCEVLTDKLCNHYLTIDTHAHTHLFWTLISWLLSMIISPNSTKESHDSSGMLCDLLGLGTRSPVRRSTRICVVDIGSMWPLYNGTTGP